MSNWNEADHPRDEIGRFTDKIGSSSAPLLVGGVGKIGLGFDFKGLFQNVGDLALDIATMALNPSNIQLVLGYLKAQYNIQELKELKNLLNKLAENNSVKTNNMTHILADELTDYISTSERNGRTTNNKIGMKSDNVNMDFNKKENKYAEFLEKEREREKKLQRRADIFFVVFFITAIKYIRAALQLLFSF